ncbi:hypothetical protein DJ535_04170 [Citrobacter murliniae]|uniref:Uncharacterized protein n=1 Tax=Citrobacter murliniae TaxID=67829 RepID=A0ABY2PY70_9ENTR|nr:hypothetical protein DJ535_04170 [Citrobacter murliniae]
MPGLSANLNCMVREISRHHNIANDEGKWVTHVNSSRCPFSYFVDTISGVFAIKRTDEPVNFIRLNEKIRQTLIICCLGVMKTVKAASI